VLDITPFVFASQATPTKYWVGIMMVDSNGAWSSLGATQTSIAGDFLHYSGDGGATWTEFPGYDGVYKYSGSYGSSEYTFDCSNLGENSVDVTVTDAGGNEVTCTATVIVTDETAPVVVCGPKPLLYSSDSQSVSPGMTIDTNGSDVVITSTLTVADDFTITDMNVPVDITHTWIGDIVMSLTSPAGTVVMLHNGTGGGEQNIVTTYDDEGNAPAGSLSDFDGESTMGDWTLTIEDTWPGLDGGMLNSWGIDYEYSYPNPNPDLIIELGPDGTVSLTPDDVLSEQYDACGFDVLLLDITEFDCDDVGTATLVTVFANDASGNFASCQVEVNIVDAMEPTLTCPDASYETEPSNNDGVYIVRDYFGIGAATYSDNCTDNSTLVVTQDPAPGTAWGINGSGNPGPYVVTFTVTDESGNVATCTLDVTVTNGIGVTENTLLDNALNMYPNPATNLVKLVNTSDIALETAMIYDINGKLITELDLNNMGTETQFDVSHFANGIYMVKIIGENASTVKRLIKE
jgi:subtilisin-like proprotein convertase family protein